MYCQYFGQLCNDNYTVLFHKHYRNVYKNTIIFYWTSKDTEAQVEMAYGKCCPVHKQYPNNSQSITMIPNITTQPFPSINATIWKATTIQDLAFHLHAAYAFHTPNIPFGCKP